MLTKVLYELLIFFLTVYFIYFILRIFRYNTSDFHTNLVCHSQASSS